MKSIKSISLLVSMLAFLFACKEENVATISAADHLLIELAQSDIIRQVENASKENGLLRQSNFLCADVMITPNDTFTWPKIVTIDYGTSNCLSADDNRFHRGVITCQAANKLLANDAIFTISPNEYYVSDVKVEGNFEIKYTGRNDNEQPTYLLTTTTGRLTNADAKTVNWSCNQTQTWLEGANTLTTFDDVFSIIGNGSGLNSDGVAFTYTISNALIKDVGCAWIKGGSITISNAGGGDMLLDFGANGCDNKATLTQNDATKSVNLL